MSNYLLLYIGVIITLIFKKIGKLQPCQCRYPVATKIRILINGRRTGNMINLNSDKEYVVSFQGEDADGNLVALPQGAVNLSLSDPSAGQLVDNGDGTFSLDPDKVGQYSLNAESNGLLGSADIMIEAGALFKISINVAEKQAPQPQE